MIIRQLKIENFRGVKTAALNFQGHTLLLGPNNVCKSTVFEALDLLLGPDRVGRPECIDEHDFYSGKYLPHADVAAPEIRIEAVLTDLSDEAQRQFRSHLEFWDPVGRKTLTERVTNPGEADQSLPALRVAFRGWYDKDEDAFQTESSFCHPPVAEDQKQSMFTRRDKRHCGFLYLRSIRTGSRALSLERGSLLDIILSLKEESAEEPQEESEGLWERLLQEVKGVGSTIGSDATLTAVLQGIDKRVREFIRLPEGRQAGALHVTNLTRQDLRKAIAYFVETMPSTTPVPFRLSGAGTLNILVFSLLTFIAELKPHGVIFAMEEPEIAISPHTQRRVIRKLQELSAQCLVTSHSPYVAESFILEHLMVLHRKDDHKLIGTPVGVGVTVKRKSMAREFRNRFAEGILGQAVLAVEGISEKWVCNAASEMIAEADGVLPFDVLGVSVIDAGGDGGFVEVGNFFRSLSLPTYAFFDQPNDAAKKPLIEAAYDKAVENPRKGLESFLVDHLPISRLRAFIDVVSTRDNFPEGGDPLPATPTDDEIKKYTFTVLKKRKGEGYAAELVRSCAASEIPEPLAALIRQIHTALGTPPVPNTASSSGNGTDTGTTRGDQP